MELHSYAKLRGYKKWTIEQKRKLVEARINYDGVFSRKSSNCQESWKKIMTAAKLNDFNVCFVRKQWANLLARYKAYKRTRLRQLDKSAGELNDQVVREISEEWEFFYPIHSFMSRKTTNFHSYAQIPRISGGSSNNSIVHDDDENGTAPDQISKSEDVKTQKEMEISIPPNTDHDFYSKSACDEILDITVKEESPIRIVPFDATDDTAAPNAETNSNNATVPSQNCIANSIREQPKDEEKVQTTPTPTKKKRQRPSERDKYYQHKRRYNRRNERRLDAILNVFGQVIKQHYPNVDTSKLEAQSDQISTEDDGDSTISMCSILSESTCTAPSSAPSDDGSDL